MAVVAPEEQAKRRGARFLACVFWSRSPGSRPPCFPCSLRSLLAAIAACCLLRLHASLALTLTVPAGSSPSFRRPKIFFELVLSVCALSFAAMTHCLAYVWGFDFQGPQPFEFLNDFTLSSWSDFLDIFLQVWNFPASPSISLSHRVVHRSCLPPGPLAHRVSHRARRCHRAARAHGARSLGIRHGSH